MLLIQTVLSVIYLFLSIKLPHSFLKLVVTFFVFLLSFQLLVNMFDYSNTNHISGYTIFIFNLNIIFLLIGVWLYVLRNLKRMKEPVHETLNPILNIKLFLCIQAVLLLIMSYYYSRYSLLIALANVDETARQLFFEPGRFFHSYTESVLYLFILVNYKYVAAFIFAYLFLQTNKDIYQNILMILSVIFIVMVCLVGQGRGDLVIPVLFVFMMSLYIKVKNPVLFKESIKLKLLIAVLVAFLAICAITLLRSRMDVTASNFLAEFNDSIIPTFVSYFSFSITAFDYGIHHIFQNESFYCGLATLAGLEELLATPLILMNKSLHVTNVGLGALMTPFHNINGQPWNALYTGVVNYYLDFGLFGVILFPTIVGYLLAKFSVFIINKSDVFYLLFYFFFLFSLYKNLFSSPFQSLEFWTFVFGAFCLQKMFRVNFKFVSKRFQWNSKEEIKK